MNIHIYSKVILYKKKRPCTEALVTVVTFLHSLSPENFFWPQTLEVSAHRIQALKCGFHTQGAKKIPRTGFVEVKSDLSYVFTIPRLVEIFGFSHDCTLRGSETRVKCVQWKNNLFIAGVCKPFSERAIFDEGTCVGANHSVCHSLNHQS